MVWKSREVKRTDLEPRGLLGQSKELARATSCILSADSSDWFCRFCTRIGLQQSTQNDGNLLRVGSLNAGAVMSFGPSYI